MIATSFLGCRQLKRLPAMTSEAHDVVSRLRLPRDHEGWT